MKINLKNLNKAIVLMVLYNNSKSQGNSFLGGSGSPMNVEEATERLKSQTSFDYLNGKVMKIELGGDTLETWLYDRDNGDGSALKAIQTEYPDTVALPEEEKELNKVEVKPTEYSEVNKVQAEGRTSGRRKSLKNPNKKKKPSKPQPKIEYSKGFFTVNGQVRKETKKQYASRVFDKLKLAELGGTSNFKITGKSDKSKK
jgi:hypothetical protein